MTCIHISIVGSLVMLAVLKGKDLDGPDGYSNRGKEAVLGNECNADLVRSGFAFCFRGGRPILPLPKCLSVDGMPCTEPTTSFPTRDLAY